MRQQLLWNVEPTHETWIPIQRVQGEHQRARSVGHVGDVSLAAGQARHEVRVNRAKRQLTGGRALSPLWILIEHPLELGTAEVGIDDQPGDTPNFVLQPFLGQLFADRSGAAVLPHNGVANRLQRRPLPQQRGLALVGDAYRNNTIGRYCRLRQGSLKRVTYRHPDVLWVVLDESGLRVDLPKLDILFADHCQLFVQDEDSGSGGSLIDGNDVTHGFLPHVSTARCSRRPGSASPWVARN